MLLYCKQYLIEHKKSILLLFHLHTFKDNIIVYLHSRKKIFYLLIK